MFAVNCDIAQLEYLDCSSNNHGSVEACCATIENAFFSDTTGDKNNPKSGKGDTNTNQRQNEGRNSNQKQNKGKHQNQGQNGGRNRNQGQDGGRNGNQGQDGGRNKDQGQNGGRNENNRGDEGSRNKKQAQPANKENAASTNQRSNQNRGASTGGKSQPPGGRNGGKKLTNTEIWDLSKKRRTDKINKIKEHEKRGDHGKPNERKATPRDQPQRKGKDNNNNGAKKGANTESTDGARGKKTDDKSKGEKDNGRSKPNTSPDQNGNRQRDIKKDPKDKPIGNWKGDLDDDIGNKRLPEEQRKDRRPNNFGNQESYQEKKRIEMEKEKERLKEEEAEKKRRQHQDRRDMRRRGSRKSIGFFNWPMGRGYVSLYTLIWYISDIRYNNLSFYSVLHLVIVTRH